MGTRAVMYCCAPAMLIVRCTLISQGTPFSSTARAPVPNTGLSIPEDFRCRASTLLTVRSEG